MPDAVHKNKYRSLWLDARDFPPGQQLIHLPCQMFKNSAYIRYVVYIIIPNQGLANYFCEGPDSKYFQLCEPHEVLVICFSFVCVCVLPHFKNVENILSSRDIQKEVLAHRP